MGDPSFAVCAVIVNWNGWRDTVVCLDSLFGLGEPPLRVLVCDNASSDASVAEIEGYFARRAANGNVLSTRLLRLPRNMGYAGALNAGIGWAREHWQPGAYWLLNNDIQAQSGALAALVDAQRSVPRAGICGSVLMEWDEPTQVQAVAGIFRRWLGVGWHDKMLPEGEFTTALDYPVGASMYVTAEYLDHVGPMDPGYFLYCEEMDWAERGRRLGYRPVVALRSRLRHKEGASTGSRGGVRNKSLLSEHYGVVNRLRITRKFWPHWLPVVWCSLALVILDRLLHGETARARLVLRLMFAPGQWLRDPRRPADTPAAAQPADPDT